MAEIPALKRRLIEQGADIIDLGAGDAYFPPPKIAVDTLTRAAHDPAMSRYPWQYGLPAFREAAAGYMRRRFGVTVDPFAELHPLLGSKEGIAHLA
jgi:LL-diaminopimelate aminotransferase